MSIRVALAGNPNSGKTTLFNQLTGSQQYVGNWPGVTVEKKEGKIKGQDILLMDLPGIYSLSPYTLEEVISRKYLIEEDPDVIINIVDATNLERNLYLTTQLLELGKPVVIAFNMMDVAKKEGRFIDTKKIEKQLGCPIVEISALRNTNTQAVVGKAVELVSSPNTENFPNIYSSKLNKAFHSISNEIQGYVPENMIDWYAIKLFERDAKVLEEIKLPSESLTRIEEISQSLESELDDSSDSIVINERYEFIDKTVHKSLAKRDPGHLTLSDKIDRVLTNRFLALPIFVVIMFLVYYISIATVGTGLTDAVNDFFETTVPAFLSVKFTAWNVAPWLSSLLLDGVIAGVGAVLGFLPQMMVLFFLLAILEDSGYMARVAFILDKLFRRFGLSGKSFIPMLITTGCGVPAIMATRTIESERDRKMTIMTTTFVPCSAKLPIIALIAGSLFADSWWVAPSIYFLGIISIIISGIILKKTKIFKGEVSPFIMELPPYHLPSLKSMLLLMWDKAKSFVMRAGSVIFVSSCIVWFLSNFNWRLQMVDASTSILASIGGVVAPLFRPLGWGDWRMSVASISGLVAKENIVGTLGVLFGKGEVSEIGTEIWGNLSAVLTPLAGYSFLAFNMLCAPCFAAIGSIKKELGIKWMWITIAYQTGFAYLVSFVIYQLGLLFSGNPFTIASAIALAVVAATVILLIRPESDKPEKSSLSYV